jgi:hypothetical protein
MEPMMLVHDKTKVDRRVGRHAPSLFNRTATAGILTHAGFLQNRFQGTEVRKGRLQEVEADKTREPEPVGAVKMSQGEAQENERAGEPADDHVHFHKNRHRYRAARSGKVTNPSAGRTAYLSGWGSRQA